MRTLCAAAVLASAFALTHAAAADEKAAVRLAVDIRSQSLTEALDELSRQAGVQVLHRAPANGVEPKTRGVKGALSVQEALDRMLTDTGYRYEMVNERTVRVWTEAAPPADKTSRAQPQDDSSLVLAQAAPRGKALASEQTGSAESRDQSAQRTQVLEEIVVTATGTRIRGAEVASPLITVTQAEIRKAGHFTLGDVVRALPQNFSGGQNPGVTSNASSGSTSNQNVTGASSINLRGLGPDATLTLVNGNRLPYDGFFQATDISAIPVSAIDRIEILLDGASAIYGTDAVGGVANVLLRRDFDGAELTARYGASTEGGYVQNQYSGVAGTTWGSGGVLFTGDYSDNTPVRARNRDYLSYLPNQEVSIYPELTQKTVLASGHQRVGELAEISLDVMAGKRTSSSLAQDLSRFDNGIDSSMWVFAPQVAFELPNAWSLAVRSSVGRNRAERLQAQFDIATGAPLNRAGTEYINRQESVGVEAEGPVFQAPGGQARASVGGGYRRSSFRSLNPLTDTTSSFGTDSSTYGFAEVNVPLVGSEADVPFVSRLALSAAVRSENYDSFGRTTTPKLGLIWGVTEDFDLKASWGKSFKVPTLAQQNQTVFSYLVGPAFGAPAGKTVIWAMGGNDGLTPERATVLSAGLALHPRTVQGLSLGLNWFRINYRDRVVEPLPGALIFQALSSVEFADFVTLDPSASQLNDVFAATGLPPGTFTFDLTGGPYDASAVHAIVSNRLTNAASQKLHGLDLSFSYAADVANGTLSFLANGNWMAGTRRARPMSPAIDVTGVAYFPAKLRSRLGVSWSRGGLTLSSFGNYVDGVVNTATVPPTSGGSMATVDVVMDYELTAPALGAVAFNLAVTNLMDRRPPYLQAAQTFDVNFDSTNYSSLGRVVSAAIRKSF